MAKAHGNILPCPCADCRSVKFSSLLHKWKQEPEIYGNIDPPKDAEGNVMWDAGRKQWSTKGFPDSFFKSLADHFERQITEGNADHAESVPGLLTDCCENYRNAMFNGLRAALNIERPQS